MSLFGEDTVKSWKDKGAIDLFEVGRFKDVSEVLPLGGIWKAKELYNVYDISKKIESGEELTDQEHEEITSYVRDSYEQNIRGYTFGGKVFSALSEVPAFMAEFFAATASLGTASAPFLARVASTEMLGKTASKKILEYASEKLIKNAAMSTIGKAALHTAGSVAVASVYTPKYAERRLNDFMAITDKGEMIFNTAQESPAKAALMTAGYTAIDFASEAFGGFIANKALKTPLTAAINKAPEAIKIGLMKAYNVLKPNESVSKAFSHLGYHGIVRELEEDAIQNVLYGAMGLAGEKDYGYKEFMNTIFPDIEDSLVTASVIALTGGIKKTAEVGANILQQRGFSKIKAQEAMDNLSANEQEVFVQKNLKLPESDYVEGLGEKIETDEKPLINNEESTFNNFYSNYVDGLHQVKLLMKDTKPIDDPYLLATLHSRVASTANEMLQRHTYKLNKDGNYEVTGKSLKTILDDHDNVVMDIEANRDVRRSDLEKYLIARRYLEDLSKNEDIEVTDEQMQESLDTMAYINSKYKDKAQWFKYTSDEYYAFNNRIFHLLVDSGNLSQEKYDEIVKANPHRVSFARELEETHKEEYINHKKIINSKINIFKLKGSDKKIKNVFESTIRDTLFITSAASKNRINKAISKLEKISPEMVQSYVDQDVLDSIDIKKVKSDIEKHSKLKEVKEKQVKENRKNIAIAKSDRKAKNTLLRSLEMRGADKSEINKTKEDINVIEKHIQALKENNKKHKTELKEINEQLKLNERAKKLYENGGVIKGREPANTIIYYDKGQQRALKVSKPLYEALSNMNPVQFNFLDKLFSVPASILRVGATITPDFFIRNTLKDQFSAMIQTNNPKAPIDTALAMANMLGKKDLYNKFRAAGGATNLYMSVDDNNIQRIHKELLNADESKIKKIFGKFVHPIRTLEDISGFFENATRVGVFKRSKQRGKNDLEAMYDALEGTVNFGRGGRITKTANRYIPFLNAGVQGVDRMVRAFKENPIETITMGVATITVPDLLLTNYYLTSDDKDEYLNIPRWQRDIFFMFKVGDHWVAYPKPFTLGYAFGSVPSRFLEYAYTQDKNAYKEMVTGLLGSVSPVNDVSGAMPQTLKVPMEIMSNYSFFFNNHFYPEYLDKRKPADRYNQNTSEVAKMLGERFELSPALIEATIKDSVGGSADYVLQAGDYLYGQYKKAAGEEYNEPIRNLSNTVFTKSFVRKDPIGSNSNSVNRFWDKWKEVEQTHHSYRTRKGKEKKKFKEENLDDLQTYNRMKSFKKQISAINKKIRQIKSNSSISGENKEKQVRDLNKQMTDIADSIIKEVD